MLDKVIVELRHLISIGDLKKADTSVSKSLRQINESSSLFIALNLHKAQIRLLLSRFDDVIMHIESLSDVLGDTTIDNQLWAQELLADAYLGRYESAQLGFAVRDDFSQAKSLYEIFIKDHQLYQNIGWIYYQHGRVELAQGFIDQAESAFRQALFSASNVVALTAYCFERLAFIAYYEKRDIQQADIFITKALQTYPADAKRDWVVRALLLRSRILSKQSFEQAESVALQALSLAQELKSQLIVSDSIILGDVLFAISEILNDSGQRPQDVIKYIQDFFHTQKAPPGVDVTWSRAYEMLGEAYMTIHLYEGAIKAFENSLQYNPDHPWLESIYYRVSKAKFYLGDIEGAESTLKELNKQLELDQQIVTDYRVYLLLADIYRQKSDPDRALTLAHKAIHLAPLTMVDEIKNQYL